MKIKRFGYAFLLCCGQGKIWRKTTLKKGDIAEWRIGDCLRFYRGGQILYVDIPGKTVCGFFPNSTLGIEENMISILDLMMAVHGDLNYKLQRTDDSLIATFF